ncbi:hypothetical protein HGM15179_020881 [Zosterops borbonicus]|uniref:Uncharacterized protein n=1 Tax=Zosterops borbonicus TaxID=364589 RepID=A0A8K1D744_9PASS|nr:hypothetical protein HGM15179_020881 [Zosterops borbonicus]
MARKAVSTKSVTVTNPEGLCPENSADPPGPDTPSGSRVVIGATVGVTVVVVILSVFLVFFCIFKASPSDTPELIGAVGPAVAEISGYWPACTARPRSASSDISATASPGHQGGLQAMRCLGPAPGPAWDRHRIESRKAFSSPPRVTDQLRPEPGPASDQHRPLLGTASDRNGPVMGPASDQSCASWVHLVGNERHSNISDAEP